MIAGANVGIANPLHQGRPIGVYLASPLDGLGLGRGRGACSLGIPPPHGIIALRPTFYEKLILCDHFQIP